VLGEAHQVGAIRVEATYGVSPRVRVVMVMDDAADVLLLARNWGDAQLARASQWGCGVGWEKKSVVVRTCACSRRRTASAGAGERSRRRE
jgi:hypothetical protein